MNDLTPQNRLLRHRGFTLVEVLVVISISAILAAVAIPSFQTTIASSKTYDATNTLSSALEYARAEAIRRGIRVSVCRVVNANAAAPQCSAAAAAPYAGNDWASGWIVFTDISTGAQGSVDGADAILLRQAGFDRGAVSTALLGTVGAGVGVPAPSFVTYDANGLRVGAAGAEVKFAVSLLNRNSNAAVSPRCLRVALLGQTSSMRGVCP